MEVEERVSKTQFKARALEYLRRVQQTGHPLVITDRGRPVLRVVPYGVDIQQALRPLRGSVLAYHEPTEPVGLDEWEALR